MQFLVRVATLASGVLLSFSVAAQAATRQPEVVVSASRTPTTVDASLASVEVITRAQIEASGSLDPVDLLRSVPGVDVVRGGGQGAQTSVFLRGTNSSHVLVLIDGVRVSALGTGAFQWEQLALGQVDRIEIVRGPRAALWGSDAIGGVIQIFTRRTEGADVALQLGNHDTWGAEGGYGWRGARGGFDLRLAYTDSGGINAQNPEGFAFDPDDDGFLHRTALMHADLQAGSQLLGLMASQRDNDIEFDRGESNTRQSQAGATLAGELAPDWEHHLAVSAMRDTLDTPAFSSRFVSRREQADWNHTWNSDARSTLVFGVSWVQERGENLDTFADTAIFDRSRSNRAGFVSWQSGNDAHRIELSARHDDNSQFGGETTFSGAWGWSPWQHTRLLLNAGEGFRAPTLNELYSPGFGGLFAGNPALDPERSHSVEAGVDFDVSQALRIGMRAYRTSIRDLIDFSGGDTFQAVNVARARVDGIELDADWRIGAWQLDANVTWQDAQNRDDGSALLRRPRRKANLALDRRFDGGVRLGIEAHAASSRADFGGDLSGYVIMALRGNLPLTDTWTLDARVENVFDGQYVLVRGFNTPGMTALLSLRWARPD